MDARVRQREANMRAKRRINTTHKAINKPLTILGAERKLFFVALIMGAAAFNLFRSLLGGLLIFGSLFLNQPGTFSTMCWPAPA